MTEGYFQSYITSILVYDQNGFREMFIMNSEIEFSIVNFLFEYIHTETIYYLFIKENVYFRTKNAVKHIVFENSSEEIASVDITRRFITAAGALNRTTASTRINSVLSRSYTMFAVNLEFERAIQSISIPNPNLREQTRAKIHDVGLADSGSLQRTGEIGQHLVLGNVILILDDPMKTKTAHVPYRDSKLTRLLQDSLCGNIYIKIFVNIKLTKVLFYSRILMIASIPSVDRDCSEAKGTINYAQHLHNIHTSTKVNHDKYIR
ncbi:unnamed protein product [Rotaria socialis]|uniref:Kinesin motor domain-containing protein n=2 Tax=Rotaria socialis TaxID=392032 RepID=A0A821LSZ0_9BILA|nr:unnamed protein product [Rotaria socialis]